MSKLALAAGAVLSGLATLAGVPVRAAPALFYAGKQITILVNYTAGGPTDIEARLLAQRLSGHIPGHPVVIVRDMPGGGGMNAVNWLGEVAPPDGLTIGYFTALAGAVVEGSDGLRINLNKLRFIAGVQSLEVYYARKDLGGGLKTPSDLMTKSGFWVGGLNPISPKDIELRAEMDLLGLSYKYISGYPGSAEARLALEQNEIQLTSESLPTYKTSIEPEFIKTGVAIPLWYDTAARYAQAGDPEGQALGVASFEQFYRKAKGPPPDSDLWRVYQLTKETSTSLLRTIVVPSAAPAAEAAALTKAIAELPDDPAYRADALKAIKYVPRFSVGPEAEKAYQEVVSVSPQTQRLVRDYAAKGAASVGK